MSGGNVARTSTSAARTIQCRSVSSPDRTSVKVSGSICAAARSAARAHRRPVVADQILNRRQTGRPRFMAPSAVTASSRTLACDRWRPPAIAAMRSAPSVAPSWASARIADDHDFARLRGRRRATAATTAVDGAILGASETARGKGGGVAPLDRGSSRGAPAPPADRRCAAARRRPATRSRPAVRCRAPRPRGLVRAQPHEREHRELERLGFGRCRPLLVVGRHRRLPAPCARTPPRSCRLPARHPPRRSSRAPRQPGRGPSDPDRPAPAAMPRSPIGRRSARARRRRLDAHRRSHRRASASTRRCPPRSPTLPSAMAARRRTRGSSSVDELGEIRGGGRRRRRWRRLAPLDHGRRRRRGGGSGSLIRRWSSSWKIQVIFCSYGTFGAGGATGGAEATAAEAAGGEHNQRQCSRT